LHNKHKRVVFVTGASSGFGKAIAEHLSKRGHQVYGTSRRAAALDALQSAGVGSETAYAMIPMDITSDRSVVQGVESVIAHEGRLDIVVNNAGFGLAGPVEETTLDEAREQFETNFWGVVRVCQAALPIMREQRFGYLINISSIGGQIAIPFQGFYSASKFALEGLMESLQGEVRSYGIRVVLIEPGDFNTNFTANRRKVHAVEAGSVYQSQFIRTLAVMEKDELHGLNPEEIAYLVEKIISVDSPRLRYVIGPPLEKVVLLLKRVLPSDWMACLIRKYYQIK
jgi:NAD(P)-dependent dehydrogenase (short-subunit alcohol dehydrogenase family)